MSVLFLSDPLCVRLVSLDILCLILVFIGVCKCAGVRVALPRIPPLCAWLPRFPEALIVVLIVLSVLARGRCGFSSRFWRPCDHPWALRTRYSCRSVTHFWGSTSTSPERSVTVFGIVYKSVYTYRSSSARFCLGALRLCPSISKSHVMKGVMVSTIDAQDKVQS